MFEDLRKVFIQYTTAELASDLDEAKIPWARINDVPAVAKVEAIAAKLTRSRMPDGREIRLQPLPVDVEGGPVELAFPPSYGEHTEAILREIGFAPGEIHDLLAKGVAVSAASR
jgi:itaconate CoA-transferase